MIPLGSSYMKVVNDYDGFHSYALCLPCDNFLSAQDSDWDEWYPGDLGEGRREEVRSFLLRDCGK